jgi:hypothetical protein
MSTVIFFSSSSRESAECTWWTMKVRASDPGQRGVESRQEHPRLSMDEQRRHTSCREYSEIQPIGRAQVERTMSVAKSPSAIVAGETC